MKTTRVWIAHVLYIVVGSFLLAVGINVFLVPGKISSGGISSIGTILLYLFDVKLSVTNLVFNVLLFAAGLRYLSRAAVIKTGVGILALTAFLELTSTFPTYGEDAIISTLVGGVLVGVGVGLVVKQNASTGGSDFAALILKRFFPHVSLANLILVLDCAVILASGIVFKSLSVTVYSILAMYVSSRVTDAVVTMGNMAKAVRIFSKEHEAIARFVMDRFERGVTGLYSRGMYSGREGMMLLCVVSPKQLPPLIEGIKQLDKQAFVVISDAREVLGEGFRPYSEYNG